MLREMRAAAMIFTLSVSFSMPALSRAQVEAEGEAEAAPAAEMTESDAVARDRFRRGTGYFDAGDYELAAREFEAAYALSHRPELLYNVYLAHERLGNLTQAIRALEDYLRDGEPGERRESLVSRLERLRQRLAGEQEVARAREERERRLREAASASATRAQAQVRARHHGSSPAAARSSRVQASSSCSSRMRTCPRSRIRDRCRAGRYSFSLSNKYELITSLSGIPTGSNYDLRVLVECTDASSDTARLACDSGHHHLAFRRMRVREAR